MAVHAVSTLNSMDNVTVFIIVLQGGPNTMPKNIIPISTMYCKEEIMNNNSNEVLKNNNLNNMANDYLSSRKAAKITSSTSPEKQQQLKDNSYINTILSPSNSISNLSIQSIKNNQLHIDHRNNIHPTQINTTTAIQFQPLSSKIISNNTIVFQKQPNHISGRIDDSTTSFNHPYQSSNNNNNIINTSVTLINKPTTIAIKTNTIDEDDDLMDFLNDDSNF